MSDTCMRATKYYDPLRRQPALTILLEKSMVASMFTEQKMLEVEVVALYIFLTDVTGKFVLYRPLVALTMFGYIDIRWLSINSSRFNFRFRMWA